MHNRSRQLSLRYALALAFLSIIIFVVWQNWTKLERSTAVLHEIPTFDFMIAIGLVLLTFLFAATSYRVLAFRAILLKELYGIEFASAFVNRLIPSGIGGLSVHGLFLHKRKHTIAQATAVVSVNNLISITVHVSLLALVLLFVGGSGLFAGSLPLQYVVFAVVLLGAGCILLALPRMKANTRSFMHNLRVSVRRYHKEPHRLIQSAVVLLALTLTNVTILALMANAVGIQLSFVQIFIIYSAGVLVGTSVPTPGGLGGVEAGLLAGFIAYGVTSELAIAAALAFRLVTYWFPLLPGGLAFIWARKLI